MADAWGGSWGTSWGVSWGSAASAGVVAEQFVGGSKKRRQKKFFPSDEYPFDNLVSLSEPEKAHKGRVQEERRESIAEEARITAQMARVRAQRDLIVAQLREAKARTSLVMERDHLAREILDIQQRARAELRRMERERSAARHRRLEFARRLKKIREDQEEEDILTIAFIAGELCD